MSGPRWERTSGWAIVIWWALMADVALLIWLKPSSALVSYGVFVYTGLPIYYAYKR